MGFSVTVNGPSLAAPITTGLKRKSHGSLNSQPRVVTQRRAAAVRPYCASTGTPNVTAHTSKLPAQRSAVTASKLGGPVNVAGSRRQRSGPTAHRLSPLRAVAADPLEPTPVEKKDTTSWQKWTNAALVVGMFCLWYWGNIVFNIWNKQLLKAFPYPLTCTCIYLTITYAIGVVGWATGIITKQNASWRQVGSFVPLAVFHAGSTALMMCSLGAVAVSFTHTIKAMEPFFMVLASALVTGALPSGAMMLALTPLVGGVALASVTEVSFNWAGFGTAIGSNVSSACRNVYSKRFMRHRGPQEQNVSSYTLLSIVSGMAALLLAPAAFFLEAPPVTPAAMAHLGLDWTTTVKAIVTTGAMMTLYQQVSYNILGRVTAVTHSVGNCMKRVVVIVSAVLFFQNPVSLLNGLGTALALVGVFFYSQVKLKEKNERDELERKQAEEEAAGKEVCESVSDDPELCR